MRRKPDPLLKTQPWRITAVFGPIERILHRLEMDGTVETAGRHVVFKDDGKGGWYDAIAAMRGVVEFHEIVALRLKKEIDLQPMVKFCNRLDAGMPLFEEDVTAVFRCISQCKAIVMNLRVSEAIDIIDTVRISAELDKLKAAA